MPSIVPGFEYDIFISYRHKDNQYDGWVTEFVENLKKELAATFKEELSVYFDENPHDGLLETQHVDKSLERKLNCLIFIPILSQTYCDPTSFAWKNEFCAFNKLATDDHHGLYVRLSNGNVESRILPIVIHEIDAQDKQVLENELGGTLRSLSFIYRTPGVNRPLRAQEDEPRENLNHIFYRDQINKVANTIKRLVVGLQMKGPHDKKLTTESTHPQVRFSPRMSLRNISIVFITVLSLLAVSYYLLNYGFGNKSPIDRSIAVLPFADMSPAQDQEYFSDGLSEELLNVLSSIPNLKVISRTSAFSFKGKNEDVREIGKNLGVAHILEGSVRKSGDKLRITAQLILVSDGSHLWSKTFEPAMDDIFSVQDEIANTVMQQLKLTLGNGEALRVADINPEAYNLYLQGKYFFSKRGKANVQKAIDLYFQALEKDKSAAIYAALSIAYNSQANSGYVDQDAGFQLAREAAEKSISLDPSLATGHYALGTILQTYDWNWVEADKEFQIAYSLDPANFGTINGMANLAQALGKTDEGIDLYKRALELDPLRIPIKVNLGIALLHGGKPKEASMILKTAAEMNTQFPTVHYQLGLSYLLQGNPEKAIEEINLEGIEDWKMHGLILAYFASDQQAKGDSLLTQFIHDYQDESAFQIAEIYGYRNDKDQAFLWLNKAFASRDGGFVTLLSNHWLRSIRSDPRFSTLLAKLHLPAISN